MKPVLTDHERILLNKRIAEAEKKTGTQIVLSIIKRSDTYPELPWKAFALGSALMGFVVSLMAFAQSSWTTPAAILTAAAVMLAGGAASALLCIFVPGFARLFLEKHRGELETREHAKSLFLDHEVFATQQRTGILLLVSLFERQIVLLPDSGLRNCLSPESLSVIIRGMEPDLTSGRVADALEEGIEQLEVLLASTKHAKSRCNELPNEIIEEKGS